MAIPFGQPAFSVGELAPSLFGRFDQARFHMAAGTMRNLFVRYQGGASSRAGTEFAGFSKQTGRNYPPRLITFQFNVQQGLALEFGNFYMRVLQDGAYVTEPPVGITAISQGFPGRVTHSGTSGGNAVSAINGGVISSYNGGDLVTLAGGVPIVPAVVRVNSSLLLDLALNSPGSGVYDIGDTIDLFGGAQLVTPELTVDTTQVVSATVATAGSSGTPGTAIVTGTTGTGTPFQARVTIDGGGAIDTVDEITVAGSYTVNPTAPAAEPVTGGGLSGAELDLQIGVETFTISDAGSFTNNPATATFTQGATSGSGTGATFRFALFGINAASFSVAGVYTTFPSNPVAQASTTGTGLGATFTVTSGMAPPFFNGDWLEIEGVNGMTPLNGRTFVVGNVTPTSVDLFDVYGDPIDTTTYPAYAGGGTISRIYTLASPYAEADLEYLKYTQSNDVMSICLVNQSTRFEYPPYDLTRSGATSWAFAQMIPSQTIPTPGGGAGAASAAGTVNYNYVITSVSASDGTESGPSGIINLANAVDISSVAGSITLTWSNVNNVSHYNVYKATPGYAGTAVPVGAPFGFIGRATGQRFIDSNILPDFTQTPPQHDDPFARGQILEVIITNGGAGYTGSSLTFNTSTGSGAGFQTATIGGSVAYAIITTGGSGYLPTDTVTVNGDGAGATAVLRVGPLSGTYPAVPQYFQQRRVYANTLNEPDTYFMSQVGAFKNFDVRTPPIATDAVIGNPWSVQLNGIQSMEDMPGGLLAFTGKAVYQLTGAGGSSFNPQPITPDSQTAQPQAFNGSHDRVLPIKIEDTILYLQSKGYVVRNVAYNYSNNIYAGKDLTVNSPHLFVPYQIVQWAWCEEPFKVVWAVRNDGIMLSLTFVREQEVTAWARHDTNGLFKSVCSVTELPLDSLYMAVERQIGVHRAYTIERMNSRIWQTVEDNWAVDCGAALEQPRPAATITASSATGLGAISGSAVIDGGSGYSAATTAEVVDDGGNGEGSGAVPTLLITGGVIQTVTFAPGQQGGGYSYPALKITDPAGSDGGSGAVVRLTLDNSATFTTDVAAFTAAVIGDVIRMGGGVAEITGFSNPTTVTANIRSPIVVLVPNSGGRPQPQTAGNWTLTTPVAEITRLEYLAGATVTGLYDGKVLEPVVVPVDGTIPLPEPASSVVIGPGFRVQLQSIMVDPPGTTTQGQRKALPEITVRVEGSRGIKAGTNQKDGSTLSPPQIEVEWTDMKEIPDLARRPYNSTTQPLWTGDIPASVFGGFASPGQVAVQQDNPLGVTVLAFIPDILPGDIPELEASKKGRS